MRSRALLLAAATAFVVSSSALAQQAVVSGKPHPGRAAKWITNSVTGDAGPASGGPPGTGLTELNITSTLNNGLPFCINDAPTTAASGYHQMCIGANAGGSGMVTYNALGGAAQQGLTIQVNGADYGFPGNGQGNILGPNASTIPCPALWNGTDGRLLKDCTNQQSAHPYAWPSSFLQTPTDVFKVNVNGYPIGQELPPGQILQAIVGAVVVPPTHSEAVQPSAAVSGYMLTGNHTGSTNSAVAIYGIGNSNHDGANPYGINAVAENYAGPNVPGSVAYDFTNLIALEADVSVSRKGGTSGPAPSGIARGALIVGFSNVRPTGGSSGIELWPFGTDNVTGQNIPWDHGFFTVDGASLAGLSLGASGPGSNVGSQPIWLTSRTPGGVTNISSITADVAGNIIIGLPSSASFSVSGHYASGPQNAHASGCGTAPIENGMTDTKGIIIIGSGTVTSCTVTFGAAYAITPSCVVTDSSTAISTGLTSITPGGFIISFSGNASGTVASYICMQ